MSIKKTIGIVEKISDTDKRPKLNLDEQIAHMREQGIMFNIDNEENAKKYLSNNTYYFKLKAYAKLYDKYTQSDKQGKYVNLEFAYLRDLATIDCYIRKEIISISLDIEHYLKVRLINDFNNSDEDGYDVVQEFMKTNPEHYSKEIIGKMEGKACSNLVKKYSGNFAIWNFVEILNFGDFKEFYQFFYSRNPNFKKSEKFSYFINPARILRNAAAHNNCLIHSLKTPYIDEEKFNYNPEVSSFLGKNGIKSRTLTTNMNKPLLHDFCVMLYLYYKIVPPDVQIYTYKRLKDLFEGRIVHHKDYYQRNPIICSAYRFINDVINVFLRLAENY